MSKYQQAKNYLERINCIVQRAGVTNVESLAAKVMGCRTKGGNSYVSSMLEIQALLLKIEDCGYVYVKGRYSLKKQTYSKPYIRKK